MNPTRLLKRLLGAATLAATGVSAEAAAADVDDLTADNGELAADLESGQDPEPGKHGLSGDAARGTLPVDLGRLEALVDALGPVDPGLAAVLVGTALASAHPVERIAFVCEWATTNSVIRRRALARALSHPFSCAGAVTAIEVLVKDQDAMVRSAAKQAALLRMSHDPERYAALLKG